ncbi:RteC domain-containing protein [Mucilaginibacter gracilis]|uniref:RteC domain-containing protein n=1 Tax=Mucilaginibacter gracilis TaxID=423350 RepID=UPI000EB3789D|nr:RteC domain-containing protein [Mucilaginibacter gracilis]
MEELKLHCAGLINRMDGELLNIRLEYPATQKWSQKSIPYIKTLLEELRIYILKHPFKKRSEEIYFFKEVKPVVMGKLIFMCEVHNKEIFRPIAGSAEEKDYLANEVEKIEDFFHNHQDLYEYYRDVADVDKTHQNDPFWPTQKGPLCQLKL